ncbi:MAG TPA: M13 family metallopeptidase, partial [Edaphobacter sp.]|nr:M13 family metallopeptidase [Edaphobacter sp.]
MTKREKMQAYTRKTVLGTAAMMLITAAGAQTNTAAAPSADKSAAPATVYKPISGFDASSLDTSVDPCSDFYKFACGRFAANHPIPADQPEVDQFYALYNVNTQSLNGILTKASAGGATRSPNEQKIGDYYKSCMDTDVIESKGLEPLQPLLDKINNLQSINEIAPLIGELQRYGIDVFFGYGEQQDIKDASKQIAFIDQGGLGLPERDYYFRTGAKDETIRKQYVEHVAKMLTLAGTPAEKAKKDADAIMAFETSLAKVSMPVTERRDPEKVYHLQTLATFTQTVDPDAFDAFRIAIHSPAITEINNANPEFISALMENLRDADLETLKAYMRYHLLTGAASRLPKRFDDENFDFYGRILTGQPQQSARWKRCSNAVNGALGEALGQVYVEQYFAGDSKAKMLEMVHDIENAMGRDLDQLDWMSAATKVKAKEKLHGIANKIGYPDKWRDYSKLEVKPDEALWNRFRGTAFENDRELNKIGKPVDHSEWSMTPPTVNAYYDPSMNDINFPAGILQPAFYDQSQDDAVNYGH